MLTHSCTVNPRVMQQRPKTGKTINPEDQAALLSFTWIFLVSSLFLSPPLCLLTFSFPSLMCSLFLFSYTTFHFLSPHLHLSPCCLLLSSPQGEDQVQLAGLRPQDHREAVLSAGHHRGAPPQCRQLHEAAAAAAQRPGHAGGQQAVPVHRGPGGEVQVRAGE